jgi:hypothetical protein
VESRHEVPTGTKYRSSRPNGDTDFRWEEQSQSRETTGRRCFRGARNRCTQHPADRLAQPSRVESDTPLHNQLAINRFQASKPLLQQPGNVDTASGRARYRQEICISPGAPQGSQNPAFAQDRIQGMCSSSDTPVLPRALNVRARP